MDHLKWYQKGLFLTNRIFLVGSIPAFFGFVAREMWPESLLTVSVAAVFFLVDSLLYEYFDIIE